MSIFNNTGNTEKMVGLHPMVQYSQELVNHVEKLENSRNLLKREIDHEEKLKNTVERELGILNERLYDADCKY